MFEIKYKIMNSLNQLNSVAPNEEQNGCIHGYFQLRVNDKKYGYFAERTIFDDHYALECITHWLEGLLSVLIELEKGEAYVALNELESYNTWLEFERLNYRALSLSVIEAQKEDGVGITVVKQPKNIIYPDWSNEIVSYAEVYNEIVSKIKIFVLEATQMYPELEKNNRFMALNAICL